MASGLRWWYLLVLGIWFSGTDVSGDGLGFFGFVCLDNTLDIKPVRVV